MEAKDIILKGALDMFMRYGIKSITMDDISRALGISKKTIYQYYSDKEALICSCVAENVKMHRELLDTIQSESKDALDEMIQLSEYIKTNVCNINPSLMYDLKKYHTKAWSIFEEFKNDYLDKCIVNTINRGVESGHYRQNINTKIIARMRVENVQTAFNPEVFPFSEFDIAKVQMELFEHFMYGICTLKGHKLLNKYKQIHEEE